MTSILTSRQRHIALVAAYTARGEQDRLESAVRGALSFSDLKEAFIHACTYLGFPARSGGSHIALSTIQPRPASGIKDDPGR